VKNLWKSMVGYAMDTDRIDKAGHERYLSLIEHKTALRIYLIGASALFVLWLCEWGSTIAAPYDRWAQPALGLMLISLYAMLRRRPASLLSTQRLAVCALGVYFTLGMFSAVYVYRSTVSPYWVANNFQWMPVVSLLLHLTFPWRWAIIQSLTMLVLVAIPALWLELGAKDPAWSGVIQSLLINGVLMQITFLVSLISVDRLKHGIGLIVSGDKEGPKDARKALESWVSKRTDELARAKEAAESASQAKSRFLAVMSHELRTPLHAMLVSADLLADKQSLPVDAAREERLLRTIQSSGQHLLTLIDQVLELSRIESGKVEAVEQPVDLQAIVQKACASVKPMAELKGLKLLTGIPDELPCLRMGDELRLTQVLINLLANATKFTMQGHIGLTLRPMPNAPAGEDWLRLSVVDTGEGMSEQAQRKAFEAFYQADSGSTRNHGGVGLGLTITQELVDLMKGRLSLKSQPGQGTRIDIDLPLPILKDTAATLPRGHHRAQDLQGQLVLIVDDDDVNRMLASEVVLSAGGSVKTVDSGMAALDYLRQDTPAVILMDWRMPDLDGLETTRRIRAGDSGDAARRIPVVGLTANAFESDRTACLDAGMNSVLTKPVERQQLLDELHRQMNQGLGLGTTRRAA
jgi:signal transduction histidine kinase/ActR/RegA family two-component response regulator